MAMLAAVGTVQGIFLKIIIVFWKFLLALFFPLGYNVAITNEGGSGHE